MKRFYLVRNDRGQLWNVALPEGEIETGREQVAHYFLQHHQQQGPFYVYFGGHLEEKEADPDLLDLVAWTERDGELTVWGCAET